MLKKQPGESTIQISFKSRNSIKGIFVRMKDFEELSQKNLWRIVSETNIPTYKQSKDMTLAKIFNGSEMTKLEVLAS